MSNARHPWHGIGGLGTLGSCWGRHARSDLQTADGEEGLSDLKKVGPMRTNVFDPPPVNRAEDNGRAVSSSKSNRSESQLPNHVRNDSIWVQNTNKKILALDSWAIAVEIEPTQKPQAQTPNFLTRSFHGYTIVFISLSAGSPSCLPPRNTVASSMRFGLLSLSTSVPSGYQVTIMASRRTSV